eukprot:gnl/MRDRNA2_/MRDRNA2_72185_c0_seq1.p1 gnl/MRDRNA2_/MRDRNA2_72185_c0~~gnl/MRDRNA2_/MRDRNA2_72185_c0_seq1.p1  ORF type:complete len:927 (+),score=203.48 gnl/MRDRNA2_/MRDRNA2_72185_c0_seq1:186-2966(+)
MGCSSSDLGEPSLTELAEIQTYLKNVPMFSRFNNTDSLELARAFTKRRYKDAEAVVTEGDPAQSPCDFFIIGKGGGVVQVGDVVVAAVKTGDHFGEKALLVANHTRAASIFAEGPLMCFVLSRVKFEKLGLRSKISTQKKQTVAKSPVEKSSVKQDKQGSKQKTQATVQVLARALRSNENLGILLGKLEDDQVRSAVERAWMLEVKSGETLIAQGEQGGDKFYMVEKGRLGVFVAKNKTMSVEEAIAAAKSVTSDTKRATKKSVVSSKSVTPNTASAPTTNDDPDRNRVSERGPGSSFGELALIHGAPRAATIQAEEDCVIWVLDRDEFRQCLIEFAQKRADKYCGLLKNVELMATLSREELVAVSEECTQKHFMDNDNIVTEGEDGDSFYILFTGQCEAFIGGNRVKQMSHGDCFGERALINKEKRAATVTVVPDCGGADCLCLDREAFETILGDKNLARTKSVYMKEAAKAPESPKVLPLSPGCEKGFIVAPSCLAMKGQLGSGEMTRTTLVQDTDTQKYYALKQYTKHSLAAGHQRTMSTAMREKEVLSRCESDFVVKFFVAYQDDDSLSLLLEPCMGNKLALLWAKQKPSQPEAAVRYYGACMIQALKAVHDLHAVHRDIRLDNVLVDANGCTKLGNFGLAKISIGRTYSFCGVSEYLAPEVVSLKTGYNRAVDWWGCGIFLYELMTGSTPFEDADPMQVYKNIKMGVAKIDWPETIQGPLQAVITGLLDPAPRERMGIKGKVEGLQKHEWFSEISWDKLSTAAPLKPQVTGAEDLNCFQVAEDGSGSKSIGTHSAMVPQVSGKESAEVVWNGSFGPKVLDLEKSVKQQKDKGGSPPFQVAWSVDPPAREATVTAEVPEEAGLPPPIMPSQDTDEFTPLEDENVDVVVHSGPNSQAPPPIDGKPPWTKFLCAESRCCAMETA